MKATTRASGAIGVGAAAVLLALSGCGTPTMTGSGTAATPTTTAEQPASAPPGATSAAPSAAGPGSAAAAAPAQILIKDFAYQGAETVRPGAEITVTNEDIEPHSITADAGNTFDAIIKVGSTTFTAPAEAGTYPYHCIFHGNMRGTLTVK